MGSMPTITAKGLTPLKRETVAVEAMPPKYVPVTAGERPEPPKYVPVSQDEEASPGFQVSTMSDRYRDRADERIAHILTAIFGDGSVVQGIDHKNCFAITGLPANFVPKAGAILFDGVEPGEWRRWFLVQLSYAQLPGYWEGRAKRRQRVLASFRLCQGERPNETFAVGKVQSMTKKLVAQQRDSMRSRTPSSRLT
jgi:hypothetical protein